MQIKFLTMANNLSHPGLKELERSLIHHGWDYEIIDAEYQRFGSKQIAFYNYLKVHPEVEYAIIADAFDVFVLGNPQEVIRKLHNKDIILFNAEKACWPYGEWAERYPETTSRWKYLNGGAAFVHSKTFIKMFEENPITHMDNDQVNLADIFLRKTSTYNFELDTRCEIFQSIAFVAEDDFKLYDGRLFNIQQSTMPVIIHGNGKTPMNQIYKLIPQKS